MGLISIPPIFANYGNFAEFTRTVSWTQSDKLSPVSGLVVGIIPLHLVGSHKITSLRVTGSNPPGGTCYIGIWENSASDGQPRQAIVAQLPSGVPFDTTALPSGGYYVTNPTDYNYTLLAIAIGDGIQISLYNIEVEATPIS